MKRIHWNPFTKTDPKALAKEQAEKEKDKAKVAELMDTMPGAKDLNMLQRFALRRVLNMSPEKRQQVLKEAMKPENMAKHKNEILTQLDSMKKTGQMSDDQYRLAKRRLGLS